ncbi:MAG: MbcA/ParS/Xre antitoxin family protein [Pseudomonadota bacterium]|nr:MbcA/ParS/Xre antitoxin family protein [Pseudomonadota bacterium]|tara:strand:- start:698 stop:916 length:219 start_codon:yes stop_codon:yes gene_type:complete
MAKLKADLEWLRAQVISNATELFEGDQEMAEKWLSKPLPAIGNEVPINYIDTSERAQQLLDIIGRLEHGVWT